MTEETYRGARQRVIELVRKRDEHALRQLLHSLYRAPGFAGVRRQVGKAVALVRAERKRGGLSCALPVLPAKLQYVARLKSESVPLTTWLRWRHAADRECPMTPRAAD